MKGRDDYNERKNQTKVYRMHSTGDRCALNWVQSAAGWNNGDYDLSGTGNGANRSHRTARRSNRGYEPNRFCAGNGYSTCNGTRSGTDAITKYRTDNVINSNAARTSSNRTGYTRASCYRSNTTGDGTTANRANTACS